MTIYLPDNLTHFPKAFDLACDHVFQSETDATFFSLLVQLISALESNVFWKLYFLDLRNESEQHKQEMSQAALNALEDKWLSLWKSHRDSFHNRKQLVKVKRSITQPVGVSYTPLYERVFLGMQEFCSGSKEAVRSSKLEKFEKTYVVLRGSDATKRHSLRMMAEVRPEFCWERLRFVQQSYFSEDTLPKFESVNGRWRRIRKAAWSKAQKRCEEEILFGAKNALRQKLANPLRTSKSALDQLLRYEDQIHRSDCEKYLKSLKNHISRHLLKLEPMLQAAEENHLLELPGTLKDDFVAYYAKRFWKEYPVGKYEEAYVYYCHFTPVSKLLGREQWEKQIRQRRLDPRPKALKVRGRGKKTRKK